MILSGRTTLDAFDDPGIRDDEEESQEADRLGRRADDLETENRDLSARLRAVSLLKVWRDSLGRGFVFSDELGHAVSPEYFPEPKPVRIETEGAQV